MGLLERARRIRAGRGDEAPKKNNPSSEFVEELAVEEEDLNWSDEMEVLPGSSVK